MAGKNSKIDDFQSDPPPDGFAELGIGTPRNKAGCLVRGTQDKACSLARQSRKRLVHFKSVKSPAMFQPLGYPEMALHRMVPKYRKPKSADPQAYVKFLSPV